MIRVNQIKVHPEAGKNILIKKAAKILGIKETDIARLEIVKQSIDARKKPEIYYSYVVDVELNAEKKHLQEKIMKRCKSDQVCNQTEACYRFPSPGSIPLKHRPVVVGMGPAGLFCAYFLAKHGYRPILLERGRDVDTRTADVNKFWETGVLSTVSNVQFGEGGAGTFSDGKLNTLVKDKDGRNKEVLRVLVEYGAPEKILYDAKPHIGTDVLAVVVKNIRNAIIDFGGEVHFETEMTELILENAGDITKIAGVVINEKGNLLKLPCEQVVLAIGHSARNTFEKLYQQNIPMEAKAFAVGMRVEHPQSMINESQYGMKDAGVLGAAPYKVTAKTSVGRGVYSFCMCPGGYVVNASSEEGHLAINGMSYSDRGGQNANSAIIVSVTPKDFGSTHPLAGVYFQRELEKKAYMLGNGKIPVQRYGDFKSCAENGETGRNVAAEGFAPCMKGAYQYADLSKLLPKECTRAFVEGMEQFGRMIAGFDRPDAVISGVESRTSSPVRIHRDETCQSTVRGLYPCGEGAGYAGGITSAAMDGVRVAEEIAGKYRMWYNSVT